MLLGFDDLDSWDRYRSEYRKKIHPGRVRRKETAAGGKRAIIGKYGKNPRMCVCGAYAEDK